METTTHKQKLESELTLVESELKAIAVYNEASGDWRAVPSSPADEADSNEAADVTEESFERQAEVSDLETRYRNIKKALEKITNETFGTCEICSKEIEAERLEANPAARTCIADRERAGELTM